MFKKIGFLAVFVFGLGCGTESETENNGTKAVGGKGDFSEDVVCDIVNKSGRGLDATQLRDPIMGFALRGGTCPTDLRELVKKLSTTECDAYPTTSVISETAKPRGTVVGSTYRLVVGKGCVTNDRDAHTLMFSVSGATAKVDNPSDDPKDWDVPLTGFEIMAFDKSEGVYNFYQHKEGDKYEFFGDSKDFVKGEGGKCGECHTSGAGVMLEIDTPWVHWERTTNAFDDADIPGAKSLVRSHSDIFGFHVGGANASSLVKNSNAEFLSQRIESAKFDGDLKRLLKPLFCPTEFNVDTIQSLYEGYQHNGTRQLESIETIPPDFWLDPHHGGEHIQMPSSKYHQAIEDSGQSVDGIEAPEDFIDGYPAHVDTTPRGAFLERAASDVEYVDALDDLIGRFFITAVLFIDFTQPIFSEKRCGLLEYLPTGIDIKNLGPDDTDFTTYAKIEEGFVKNLKAATNNPSADELVELFELSTTELDNKSRDEILAFQVACDNRDKKEMMDDVARLLSFHRNKARTMGIFQQPSKLPTDMLNEQSLLTLDPVTCKIQ